ncbi:MAG: hypothetical protein ACRAVC_20750 [Trichormus sp.]
MAKSNLSFSCVDALMSILALAFKSAEICLPVAVTNKPRLTRFPEDTQRQSLQWGEPPQRAGSPSGFSQNLGIVSPSKNEDWLV